MAGTAQAAADARRARDRWEHTRVWKLDPRTVRWLVDSSGYTRAALARKAGVAPAVFERRVETGSMTHSAIKRLAAHLRRPPLLFHGAPHREPVLADYRGGVATGTGVGTAPALAPMDIVAVRRAWGQKSRAGEMIGDLEGEGGESGEGGGRGGGSRCRAPSSATVGDDPCTVAAEAAAGMGLPGGAGRVWPPGFDALRDAVERHGDALVFQEPMDMRSVRAVTLAGGAARAGSRAPEGAMVRGARDWDFPARSPHAILLNAGDAGGTRSFSMLHGYGHILLGAGDGGGWSADGYVCKEGRGGDGGGGTAAREEAWCDSFAAAVLMPPEHFSEDRGLAERMASSGARCAADAARMAAASLSGLYEASMYAAAVRMIDASLPPPPDRRGRYEALAREVENTTGTSYGRPAMRRAGRHNRAEYCESRLGRRFVRTVLDAEERGLETLHEAIDMLGIRLDDFDRVAALAGGWPEPEAAA